MASLLSSLANNLPEEIYKLKCKFGHNYEKCETFGIKCEYCDCFLKYTNFKDDLIEYKCLCSNKSYQQKFNKKLKERFFNTKNFSNHDNNKFILLLQKGVYPYEYMNVWEKLDETLLPEKEDFYIHLNMEDTTDAEWIKILLILIKNSEKTIMKKMIKGYFLEFEVQFYEKLHENHNDLSFLTARMKIEKVQKLGANLHDKTEYAIHIRNLKQALYYRLVLKKVHRVIKFNQNAWLKPYIDMNTDLRKKAKNDFEKDFFKLMNNAVFGKTMENVRKHRDIKLATTERRRNYLVLEPSNHTKKFFTENLLAIEMKKAEKVKLYYIDTDSFILHIKAEDIYKDIAEDVETRFDTPNYELECNSNDRSLPKKI